MILVEVRALLDAVARSLSENGSFNEQDSTTFLEAARDLCFGAASEDGDLHEREESCVDSLFWSLPADQKGRRRPEYSTPPEQLEAAIEVVEAAMDHLGKLGTENGSVYAAARDPVLEAVSSACQIVLSADDEFHLRELTFLTRLTLRLRTRAIEIERELQSEQAQCPADSQKLEVQGNANAHAPRTIQELLVDLHALVGLRSVKQQVETLVNVAKIFEMRRSRGLAVPDMSFHLIFVGNPGTGKTTVARIIAGVYGSLGLLAKDNFIETDRSGLVGSYVGQTAIKTSDVLNTALDGVLFIDEAYALAGSDMNDYGQEAVETLLKFMEDNRDRIVIIAAGYAEEMQTFLGSNPGLRSRFTQEIEFTDFDAEELVEIFLRMAVAAGYTLDISANSAITVQLKTMWGGRAKNFANGRAVRNLFESVIREQSDRLSSLLNVPSEVLCSITADDILGAGR